MSELCRLYLITPPAIELPVFAEDLKRALDGGDVACLQLRLKGASDDDILRASETVMPLAHDHDVAFIVNDRPDLAHKIGADGAHIGQDDMPYQGARSLLGPDQIIGVTCHNSKHLAMIAGEAGADYIAFGAFFPTTTKEPKSKAGLDLLTWWSTLFEVPVVAIGGITVENCPPLVKAGADFLAVSSGVWDFEHGPKAAVSAFHDIFTA